MLVVKIVTLGVGVKLFWFLFAKGLSVFFDPEKVMCLSCVLIKV